MAEQSITNQEEGVCPNCGNFGCLEYDCNKYYLDGDYLVFPFVCEKCGFKGEELNSLMFEENREASSLNEDNKKHNHIKDWEINTKSHRIEKAQDVFIWKDTWRSPRKSISSDFRLSLSYSDFAKSNFSFMSYRDKNEHMLPSNYKRENLKIKQLTPYKLARSRFSNQYQRFRANKKGLYFKPQAKQSGAYARQARKLYFTTLEKVFGIIF